MAIKIGHVLNNVKYSYSNNGREDMIKDMICVESRSNNPKRDFLFVNRYQGKHIPTKIRDYTKFISALTNKIIEETGGRKDIMVIGFAETATALAQEIWYGIETNGYYMQTTREKAEDMGSIGNGTIKIIEFKEEHSHATDHTIYGKINDFCECDEHKEPIKDENGKYRLKDTGYILFVDDEITTGNTIINMIKQLETKLSLEGIKLGVASVCNWQNTEDRQKFKKLGIETISLIQGEIKDKHLKLGVEVIENEHWNFEYSDKARKQIHILGINTMNWGCSIQGIERCGRVKGNNVSNYVEIADSVKEYIERIADTKNKKICVVGTEEFMFIPNTTAQAINSNNEVYVQATTRSSINIMAKQSAEVNGLFNKVSIESAYDRDRKTYLYNLDRYDEVFVITDATRNIQRFAQQITEAFVRYGTNAENVTIIQIV